VFEVVGVQYLEKRASLQAAAVVARPVSSTTAMMYRAILKPVEPFSTPPW